MWVWAGWETAINGLESLGWQRKNFYRVFGIFFGGLGDDAVGSDWESNFYAVNGSVVCRGSWGDFRAGF
jgi:hypothetical protein